MAANRNPQVSAGGGDFLQILGIIYLVKLIRRRRRARQQAAAGAGPRLTRGQVARRDSSGLCGGGCG